MKAYGLIYLVLQAAAILLWWLGLFLYPDMRAQFFPQHAIQGGLIGWFAADLVLVILSILAVGFARAKPRVAVVAGTAVFGGLTSPTVQCVIWAINDGLLLSAVLMFLALAGTAIAILTIAKRV
ncbi:MAG: hypothetical protein IT366_23420 [Candidatus Hydrogenedentes bacterium]|nr:hypothetical protein [Candidatus Hydrogenedentota bacterium]